MKAILYGKPGEYKLSDVPVPEPGAGEVRIKITAAGVCGTDIHLHNGTFIGKYPLVPGHEMVGVIDKIGAGPNGIAAVSSFKTGQQVTMNGNYGCGECDACKKGKPLYCTNLTCLGCNGTGAFAEYMVVPERLVYDAEGLDVDTVVFTEPLACTCHGIDVLDMECGSDVLLIGAGSTGAMLAQMLIHGGAGNVTVAASKDFKLELMKRYGINDVVKIDKKDSKKSAAILKEFRPEGFDIVIDATGAPSVQQECLGLVKTGGTVMFYGVGKQDVDIPVNAYDIFAREITIKGSFAQVNSFPKALAMLRSGRIKTDGLITHRYSLDKWGEAMDTFKNDPSCHKIVLVP